MGCQGLRILSHLLYRCRSLRCALSPVLFLLLLRLVMASPAYPSPPSLPSCVVKMPGDAFEFLESSDWSVDDFQQMADAFICVSQRFMCVGISKSSLLEGSSIFLTLVSFLLFCLCVGFCLMTIFPLMMAKPS